MYLLNAVFETVHVFKPVTSKEGNSECYVICIKYLHGWGDEGRDRLIEHLSELTKHMGE